jgi:hypothetical protein
MKLINDFITDPVIPTPEILTGTVVYGTEALTFDNKFANIDGSSFTIYNESEYPGLKFKDNPNVLNILTNNDETEVALVPVYLPDINSANSYFRNVLSAVHDINTGVVADSVATSIYNTNGIDNTTSTKFNFFIDMRYNTATDSPILLPAPCIACFVDTTGGFGNHVYTAYLEGMNYALELRPLNNSLGGFSITKIRLDIVGIVRIFVTENRNFIAFNNTNSVFISTNGINFTNISSIPLLSNVFNSTYDLTYNSTTKVAAFISNTKQIAFIPSANALSGASTVTVVASPTLLVSLCFAHNKWYVMNEAGEIFESLDSSPNSAYTLILNIGTTYNITSFIAPIKNRLFVMLFSGAKTIYVKIEDQNTNTRIFRLNWTNINGTVFTHSVINISNSRNFNDFPLNGWMLENHSNYTTNIPKQFLNVDIINSSFNNWLPTYSTTNHRLWFDRIGVNITTSSLWSPSIHTMQSINSFQHSPSAIYNSFEKSNISNSVYFVTMTIGTGFLSVVTVFEDSPSVVIKKTVFNQTVAKLTKIKIIENYTLNGVTYPHLFIGIPQLANEAGFYHSFDLENWSFYSVPNILPARLIDFDISFKNNLIRIYFTGMFGTALYVYILSVNNLIDNTSVFPPAPSPFEMHQVDILLNTLVLTGVTYHWNMKAAGNFVFVIYRGSAGVSIKAYSESESRVILSVSASVSRSIADQSVFNPEFIQHVAGKYYLFANNSGSTARIFDSGLSLIKTVRFNPTVSPTVDYNNNNCLMVPYTVDGNTYFIRNNVMMKVPNTDDINEFTAGACDLTKIQSFRNNHFNLSYQNSGFNFNIPSASSGICRLPPPLNKLLIAFNSVIYVIPLNNPLNDPSTTFDYSHNFKVIDYSSSDNNFYLKIK